MLMLEIIANLLQPFSSFRDQKANVSNCKALRLSFTSHSYR